MAYNLNGSSQYLSTASTPVSAYPITIAAIVYPTATGFRTAVSLGNTGAVNDYYYLSISGTNLIQFGLSSTTDVVAYSATACNLNEFSHFCGVITSSSAQAFLNGAAGTVVSHSVSWKSVNALSVGAVLRNAGVTSYFSGRVAEVGIWNAELTAAEIASLSTGFTPDQIRPQSLQFYAPLIRDLVDLRAGRSITNLNGATISTHPRVIQ
jgi:hypothetical protein